MGTDLKTIVVLVCVEYGELIARACRHTDSQSIKFLVRHRSYQASSSSVILVGFETHVGEFEIHSERGRGLIDLCEKYPSIDRVEDSRTVYRFGREAELLLFRMTWDWDYGKMV